METIRKQLHSGKVFDVIGRLFEGVSIKEYLEQSLADEDSDAAVARLEGSLTEGQVRAIEDKERLLFGSGGDVKGELAQLSDEVDQEGYRRLLPGYVRRFVEKASALLDLRIEGDLETTFRLVPTQPRALDPLLPALERYPEESRDRLTVYRANQDGGSVWVHPGEPMFDQLSALVVARFGVEGLKGSVFVDPYAVEPYLFHIALVTVEQTEESQGIEEEGVPPRAARRRSVEGEVARVEPGRTSADQRRLHRGVAGGAPASAQRSGQLRAGWRAPCRYGKGPGDRSPGIREGRCDRQPRAGPSAEALRGPWMSGWGFSLAASTIRRPSWRRPVSAST